MGLFQQRPEEPTEWAGLPSEPAKAQPPAAHLDASTSLDSLGLAPGSTASVSVPLPAPES
ncbi:hypothetical protein [Microbacterium sp. NPDC055357]